MKPLFGRGLTASAMRPQRGPVCITHRQLASRCFKAGPFKVQATQRASYHSDSSPSSSPPPTSHSSAEHEILTAAMRHVPAHGFTQQTLAKGAESAGYLPTSLALLPRGAFELVMFHLVGQRLGLKDQLAWHQRSEGGSYAGDAPKELQARIRQTILTRLHGNTAVIQHLTQAIALMSLARNIPSSLSELGRLSDEILYLAGDTSVDSTWYLKRGAISGVYAAAEAFMTQDQSTDFIDTERFLERRLEDLRGLGQSAADIGQFVGFAGISTVNILRSWNVRI